MNAKNLNIPAIIISLLVSIGCFLPWVQLMGFSIRNHGFNNLDSMIVLGCGIISLLTAVSTKRYDGIYIATGIIGAAVGFINYFDLNNRGKSVSAASGLYVILVGTVALTVIGLVGLRKRKTETKNQK